MAKQQLLTTGLSISQSAKLLEYAKRCATIVDTDVRQFRTQCVFRDKAYMRTLRVTAEQIQATRAMLVNGKRKIGDLDVPIIMPQVETGVAYQTGVFCSSYPIFGVIASQQEMDAALQLETVFAQQAQRHGWVRELIKVFRDGEKYNFGAAVVQWKQEKLSRMTTSTSDSTAGLAAIQGYSYGANQIKHVNIYNCFMDTRVSPAKIHTDAEFFGYNELMSKVSLKRFLQSLDQSLSKNFRDAYESEYAANSYSDGSMGYYVPQINPFAFMGDQMSTAINWNKWAGLENNGDSRINYKDNYVVTHFYCRACPSDFGGEGDIPQIYYAVIVNWKYVVFVERQVTIHDYLPALVMQPNEDGLGYQTQSTADVGMTFQDMASGLWNVTLEGKRRQIFDRMLYDPSMVNKADIDPADPVARIPIKNAGLGKDNPMQRAVYQIPFRNEEGLTGVQLAQTVSQFADEAAGQNKVSRGQFQKGNKTTTEFETTQQNSNSRQQLKSLVIEYQFMTPCKEIIKSNTLQFQTSTSILNKESQQIVPIDPVTLRKAMLEFRVTDGVLPMEKIMNPSVMQVFLQTAQAIPTLQSEYDIMGMFVYWAKLQGATWLSDFKRNPQQQSQFLQLARDTQQAQNPQTTQQANNQTAQVALQAQQQAQLDPQTLVG